MNINNCPFCGEAAHTGTTFMENEQQTTVGCDTPGCRGRTGVIGPDETIAIEIWNHYAGGVKGYLAKN